MWEAPRTIIFDADGKVVRVDRPFTYNLEAEIAKILP